MASDAKGRKRTADVCGEVSSFQDLLLPDRLVHALGSCGFVKPSPVQQHAIPVGRLGSDLMVQAKSGTGKTVVYSAICLDRLDLKITAPQALVLVPTRELALQSADIITRIAAHLPAPAPVCAAFVGGLPIAEDEKRLRRKCDVIVGTPGRILALLQRRSLVASFIHMFVLDEVDCLLAEGFYDEVTLIYDELPRKKQVMAFSATYTPELLADLLPLMKKPHKVWTSPETVSLLGVKQFYQVVGSGGQQEGGQQEGKQAETPSSSRVLHEKVQALLGVLSRLSFHQAVVFCNYRPTSEWLAQRLTAAGFPSEYLSGGRAQEERMKAMTDVRAFKLRVIVSTDVMARGVDLDRVNLVVNMDLPMDSATYVHRVGRTGRFGTHGVAVTLVTEEELQELMDMVEGVKGGQLSPLPADIPMELYGFQLESQWEQEALEKLLQAPTETPPATPPSPGGKEGAPEEEQDQEPGANSASHSGGAAAQGPYGWGDPWWGYQNYGYQDQSSVYGGGYWGPYQGWGQPYGGYPHKGYPPCPWPYWNPVGTGGPPAAHAYSTIPEGAGATGAPATLCKDPNGVEGPPADPCLQGGPEGDVPAMEGGDDLDVPVPSFVRLSGNHGINLEEEEEEEQEEVIEDCRDVEQDHRTKGQLCNVMGHPDNGAPLGTEVDLGARASQHSGGDHHEGDGSELEDDGGDDVLLDEEVDGRVQHLLDNLVVDLQEEGPPEGTHAVPGVVAPGAPPHPPMPVPLFGAPPPMCGKCFNRMAQNDHQYWRVMLDRWVQDYDTWWRCWTGTYGGLPG